MFVYLISRLVNFTFLFSTNTNEGLIIFNETALWALKRVQILEYATANLLVLY